MAALTPLKPQPTIENHNQILLKEREFFSFNNETVNPLLLIIKNLENLLRDQSQYQEL